MSLKSKIYAVFVFNLENFSPDRIFYAGNAHGARNNYQVCTLVLLSKYSNFWIGWMSALMSTNFVSTLYFVLCILLSPSSLCS